MIQNPDGWTERFTDGFLPNGWTGVVVAMGLTFIAFEGYEIIAQSGEEIKDPKRNLPRATFISIGVVVFIYIAVAFVAIGAVTPPPGMATYQFLGEQGEVAIVEAARQIMPYGGIILTISALASTMSALIATTYSSSRVSFAMGRDFNLPKIFGRVHPVRHTPYWAVILSGILILVMAWALPIEDVAAAADLMFLFLFIQVNVSVMRLRLRRPDLDRGFITPFFPAIPIAGDHCHGSPGDLSVHLQPDRLVRGRGVDCRRHASLLGIFLPRREDGETTRHSFGRGACQP